MIASRFQYISLELCHTLLVKHQSIEQNYLLFPMAAKILTYLVGDPDGKIHTKTSTRGISDVEVVVKVTHSGVCGTDAHDRVSGCGLGHEGVGIVEELGKNVTAVKQGQRVGWGWLNIVCDLHSPTRMKI
jgi:hypothetical protein